MRRIVSPFNHTINRISPFARWIPNGRLFRRLEPPRHFRKGTCAALGATFVKVGQRGWAGWHFAARNCAWHRGRNSFLPSLAQRVARATSPAYIPRNVSLPIAGTGLISYGCLVDRFVSLQGIGEGRRKERRESKLEWWGSAGGGISRRSRVDRDRSERVPLCIPAKFGLSNYVSPTLLPSRTRGADHPDIRSESREMIWQRSNRSSGEGFAGPDPTSPAPFQPESLSFPTANTQDILGSAKIRSPMDGKNGYPSFPKNETRWRIVDGLI